ncbi:MAG: class I SAM-dependent methyltransferase [Proteobacteria bacterium]|nr:class I SAM-dependent methyltransferase [Pseudomonadota bacterium]
MGERKVSFGFEDVDFGAKAGLVGDVFRRVAPRYDIMNDLMSGGLHRLWKRELVNQVSVRPGGVYLDVAAGTGDIARRLKARLKEGQGRFYLCDPNPAMLEEGRKNALDSGDFADLTWVCGRAEDLPFEDNTFDAYTISFGLRNVTDIEAALNEARRVLRPGGSFFCLEFSKITHALPRALYKKYAFEVIPRLGGLVADDEAAYRYLVESIERFPEQTLLAAHLEDAGFAQVSYLNMTYGVVALHRGLKL